MTKKLLTRAGFVAQGLLLVSTAYGGQQQPDTLQIWTINQDNGLIASKRSDTSIIYSIEQRDAANNASMQQLASPKVELNSMAKKFVAGYLEENEETLKKVQQRSGSWFKIFDNILAAKGLPLELKYLAVIESKLKTNAVSHCGAVGPWQIMPVTARELGLKVNSKIDERKSIYKSTRAAADYLKDLYKIFDDWLLVIAAYNAGPGTVLKAIKNSGSRNFWKLQYHLPLETRLHVKRFIGAHYFFQEEGSETVLTKYELLAYQKKVNEFLAMRKQVELPQEMISIEITDSRIVETPLSIPTYENIETNKEK
ncbi:MAG TPA: lytic transglycosylase domain-containing protein [Flavisolibacter sp.]|nr:lytic transglycosylase domain-containing protein [Flavisolibacter sp.]